MSAIALLLAASSDGPRDGLARAAPLLLGMPEAEAIERMRHDDERTYEHIFRVFRPRLVTIARDYVPAAVAEEIAHDVLALLWERRASWPAERGIATYLYAAARNRARDDARHHGVVGRVSALWVAAEEVPGTGTQPASPDSAVENHELGRAFIKALGRLPEGARTAFTLRWVHQLSYPEIAEIMQIAEAAARKQVSRARETLLAALQQYVK